MGRRRGRSAGYVTGSDRRPDIAIGELGEFGVVARFAARLQPQGPGVLLGPGDDAAVLKPPDDPPDDRIVATTDLLVEGRHFRRDWSGPYDVGRKAAAQNLADVAAMGGVPTALLVGFAAPPQLPVEWVDAFADGLREECAVVGASVVGGDVVRCDLVVLGITAFGSLRGRSPVTRSGARPGDVVVVAGRLGWAAAGFVVLSRGFRSPKVLVEAHRRPEPPYAMGPVLADAGATAMVDVSDGLVQDLGHVAAASGVGIELESAAFEVTAAMRDVASALGADPLRWVLAGGDEHALAATLPPDVAVPTGCRVVGHVVEGAGVLVDGAAYDAGGFDHFG
ncbi:MAG TPA: thiamine-phosphate kinase [Mycobacteriales bacterium]|nr:thiamine-phosphate kinase [Mycobacteriales bacterium]